MKVYIEREGLQGSLVFTRRGSVHRACERFYK